MLKVALPEASVPEPSREGPLKKFTVPVGVNGEAVTVAVKVMDWPKVEGFTDDVSVVVLGTGLMVCVTAAEEVAKFAVPT